MRAFGVEEGLEVIPEHRNINKLVYKAEAVLPGHIRLSFARFLAIVTLDICEPPMVIVTFHVLSAHHHSPKGLQNSTCQRLVRQQTAGKLRDKASRVDLTAATMTRPSSHPNALSILARTNTRSTVVVAAMLKSEKAIASKVETRGTPGYGDDVGGMYTISTIPYHP